MHVVRAMGIVSAARAALARAPAVSFSTSAPIEAAARKAAPKKRVAVRKGGMSGPRRTGGRRKGGVDSSASLSKSSEFFVSPPNMSDLSSLDSTAIAAGAAGQVVAWTNRVRNVFSSFGLPREIKREFALQPRPRTVIREASVRIVDALQESVKQPIRSLLVGRSGSGKSTFLLQALAHAVESKWAVVYIPGAIDLINSSTPYTFNAQQATYLQPEAASALLGAIATANKGTLSKLKSVDKLTMDGKDIQAGTPLDKLIDTALKSADQPAQQLALELVLRSLAEQKDVPVLVAIDDVQALFSMSWYRDPDFRPMRSFELAIPRALLAFLQKGVQSGAVLTAASSTHSEFPVPPELLVALRDKAGVATPAWRSIFSTFAGRANSARVREPDAYTPLNEAHLTLARGADLTPLHVGDALQLSEASSLFDVLQRERLVWEKPCDEFFISKLVESDGIIRIFEKSLRRTLM
ncbi:hypothetical protein MCUN1_002594 [Malassezia cuniculi]|uniref:Small ribosomal subunit protein mS29 n=1 Tax=Malassezia cuniculi TaxID=948313 RepID=A0AAF0ERR8_9BASI|nr:hypothetical protein MCUN1_002594 [Malassezia cuniculi]